MAKSEMSLFENVLGTSFLLLGLLCSALAIKGNPGNFCLCNPESWGLESGIPQIIAIGIQVPLTKDPESITWNPESKTSWIPLNDAICDSGT